jgi:hypothetical protein
MHRRLLRSVLMTIGTSLTLCTALPAAAETVTVQLRGFEEVPSNTTDATGSLRLFINDRAGTIDYELSYANLTGNVTQAHIHVGQPGVVGGISLWFCGTATNPGPAGTQLCPASGTITGTLTASNVVGPTGQLVAPGELDEVIRAIRAGFAYGNVHSSVLPGGEIRGQLH